jgi:hypothetical protein
VDRHAAARGLVAEQPFLPGSDGFRQRENRVIVLEYVARDFNNARVEHRPVYLPERGQRRFPAPKFAPENNVGLRENRVQPVDPDEPAQHFLPVHAPRLGGLRGLDLPGHECVLRHR